jgi:hypothetical protein
MLNQKNFPKVYIYDGSLYTDISAYALNFGRDFFQGHLHTNHFLYFGRVKPFAALYIEMGAQKNNVDSLMNVEYFNGSSWVAVSNLNDDSLMFKRSGFVQFDLPADWAATTVGFHNQFFIRISPTVNTSNNIHIQGMNIVFSDDQDLNGVYPGIISYLNNTEISFVLRHENSRNLIVQDIRNRGFTKKPAGVSGYEQMDEWDFLRINECKQWSIYLTLSNIFSSLQSNDSDMYKEKADDYAAKADLYKAAFYLTLDRNDDGKVSAAESAGDIHTRRLVRG